MQNAVAAALLGLILATPAAAQVPDVKQLLQGLTTGNQNQDQALRDAFERGYQRGRQDEARLQRSGRSGVDADRSDRRGAGDRDSGNSGDRRQEYRDEHGFDQPQNRQGNTYNRQQ